MERVLQFAFSSLIVTIAAGLCWPDRSDRIINRILAWLDCEHSWSWPRRRGNVDVQVCAHCGRERESKVQFGGRR